MTWRALCARLYLGHAVGVVVLPQRGARKVHRVLRAEHVPQAVARDDQKLVLIRQPGPRCMLLPFPSQLIIFEDYVGIT